MVTAIASINGDLVAEDKAVISILDRGFTLADGIFETMTAIHDNVRYLERHLKRLADGCAVLDIMLPPESDIRATLLEVLRANKFALSTVRLTVSRGYDHKRGLLVHNELAPSIIMRVSERNDSTPMELRLMISEVKRNEGSPLANLKTLAYTDSVFARKIASDLGYDDALMTNNKGNVVCATSSNFFVVKDGSIITPPLTDGVLPGIVRSLILEGKIMEDINSREDSISPVFNKIEGAFLTNVVTGITNISHIDGQTIGSADGHKLIKRLSDSYVQGS